MIFRPHTYDMDIQIQIQEHLMAPQLPVDDKPKPDAADRPASGDHGGKTRRPDEPRPSSEG
jgi:hypothetical protein